MKSPRQILLRFDLSELEGMFPDRFQRSLSRCPQCGGSGWRNISTSGDRRVTRCECRKLRSRPAAEFDAPADLKAIAAGERG